MTLKLQCLLSVSTRSPLLESLLQSLEKRHRDRPSSSQAAGSWVTRVTLAKGRTLPVYWTQQNRYDAGFACLMAFHCPVNFDVVAGVVGDRVGADQQQDNIGAVEAIVDHLGAIVAGENLATILACD